MNDNENLNATQQQLQIYETFLHEKNRKRVQWGIRLLLFGPLVFVAMMMLMDSNKNIYLLLWIISLFVISSYLIAVEYMDFQMQEKLQHLGIASQFKEENEIKEKQEKQLVSESNTSFLPLKQLKEDWKAVSLEEAMEEERIEQMIAESKEECQEDEVYEEEFDAEQNVSAFTLNKKNKWTDYDFDPYEEGQKVSDKELVFEYTDENKTTTEKVWDFEKVKEQPEPKADAEIIAAVESSIREKIEAEVRAKIEAEMRAKIEAEWKERMDTYIDKEVEKMSAEMLQGMGISKEVKEETES